ncbi:hypothetical protein I4U23_015082 [Adineta vaga]|nr:hypothetical protein I4U23_015082 [Adineta vaga]
MSNRLYFVLLIVIFSIGIDCKSPTKGKITQRIHHLLNITESEKKFNDVLESHIASDPTLAAYKSEILKFINTFLSFQSLRPHIVEIYRDLYTTSDINGLIKFYSSPLGKKFLEKETQTELRLTALVEKKLQEQMPQIMSWFQQKFYESLSNNNLNYTDHSK